MLACCAMRNKQHKGGPFYGDLRRILILYQRKSVFDILNIKMATFHAISLVFCIFSGFQSSFDLGSSKSLSTIFRVTGEKMTREHVSQHPNQNFQFDFFCLVALDDLGLKYALRNLWMVLRCAPDTINDGLLTFSTSGYWSGYSRRPNQTWQIATHCKFGLICDVVGDPEVNNIGFSAINFPDLSNVVWIL